MLLSWGFSWPLSSEVEAWTFKFASFTLVLRNQADFWVSMLGSIGVTGTKEVFSFFLFCHTHGMWKFLGQGWNLCHSSDPSCWSNTTGSLIHWAIRELQNLPPYKSFLFFCFFFFFSFWPLLGQASDPSCIHDLSCTCGTAGSLTHCDRLDVKPVTQHSQDAANPIVPEQELQTFL